MLHLLLILNLNNMFPDINKQFSILSSIFTLQREYSRNEQEFRLAIILYLSLLIIVKRHSRAIKRGLP